MEQNTTLKEKLLYILISAIFIVGIIFAMQRKNKIVDAVPVTSNLTKYSTSCYDVFDTVSEFVGYAETEAEFKEITDKLIARLTAYNKFYDIYHSYKDVNNIKTINDNAGICPIKVDRDIIDLLLFAKELYYNTDGQTNIALGSVLKIWHNYRTEAMDNPEVAAVPSEEELFEAAKHTDIEKIIIDEEKCTVFLADSNMSIDVGSIGKGYAVQKIAEYAKELGVDNMLISVGGNICSIGSHEDGTPWKLGIQNPDVSSEQAYIEKVTLSDGQCIVTSGDYQRYYYVGDKKYCHIIDPDTLYSADYFAAVSIITNNSGVADALSTAVFCMSAEEGLAYINSLEGVEAMWVLHDGSVIYSNDFEKYIVKDNQ